MKVEKQIVITLNEEERIALHRLLGGLTDSQLKESFEMDRDEIDILRDLLYKIGDDNE